MRSYEYINRIFESKRLMGEGHLIEASDQYVIFCSPGNFKLWRWWLQTLLTRRKLRWMFLCYPARVKNWIGGRLQASRYSLMLEYHWSVMGHRSVLPTVFTAPSEYEQYRLKPFTLCSVSEPKPPFLFWIFIDGEPLFCEPLELSIGHSSVLPTVNTPPSL